MSRTPRGTQLIQGSQERLLVKPLCASRNARARLGHNVCAAFVDRGAGDFAGAKAGAERRAGLAPTVGSIARCTASKSEPSGGLPVTWTEKQETVGFAGVLWSSVSRARTPKSRRQSWESGATASPIRTKWNQWRVRKEFDHLGCGTIVLECCSSERGI